MVSFLTKTVLIVGVFAIHEAFGFDFCVFKKTTRMSILLPPDYGLCSKYSKITPAKPSTLIDDDDCRIYQDYPDDACIDVSPETRQGMTSVLLGDWDRVIAYREQNCRGLGTWVKSNRNCWENKLFRGFPYQEFTCLNGSILSIGGPKYEKRKQLMLESALNECVPREEWLSIYSYDNTDNEEDIGGLQYYYKTSIWIKGLISAESDVTNADQKMSTKNGIQNADDSFVSVGQISSPGMERLKNVFEKLSRIFLEKLSGLGDSSSTGWYWGDAWRWEITEHEYGPATTGALAHYKTEIFQLHGLCGPAKVSVQSYKPVAFDRNGTTYKSPFRFEERIGTIDNVTYTYTAIVRKA